MTRAPRILQAFNLYRQFGGEEDIVRQLSSTLSAGTELLDVFFDSKEWTGAGSPPRWRQALMSLYNPESRDRLISAHRAFRPDVWLFHNMFPVGSPSAFHAALQCGTPVIQYLHNYRPFTISGTYWNHDRLVAPRLRARHFHEAVHGCWNGSIAQGLVMAASMRLLLSSGWLQAVRAWVGVSQAICDHLEEAGIPKDRLVALPPAWPFDPALEARSHDDYFLFLGRLIPEKGISVLLRGWTSLFRESGSGGPRLMIAGSGPLQSEVLRQAAANPLIEYRGQIGGNEKEMLLSRSIALIVPSLWWDPNPTVVGEAFNSGKPVLAARSGGLPYRVVDGQTGLLHDPGDEKTLMRQVLELRDSPELLATLGTSAREWLRRQSDKSAWRRRFFTLLECVIENGRPPRSSDFRQPD